MCVWKRISTTDDDVTPTFTRHVVLTRVSFSVLMQTVLPSRKVTSYPGKERQHFLNLPVLAAPGSLICIKTKKEFSVSSSCLASSSAWKRRKRFLFHLPVWDPHLLGSVFCIVFLSGSLISMETNEALSVSSSCSSSAWQPPCSVASFSRGGQGRASHAATSADLSSRSTAPPSSPMRFSASLSHLKDNHNTLINSRAGQNTFDFHPENKTFTRPRRVRRDSRQWNATRVKQEAKCGRRRLPQDG